MSAMRSASSTMTTPTSADRHVTLLSRSIMRPGVATTRSAPFSSSLRLPLDRCAAVDADDVRSTARRAERAPRSPARRAHGSGRGRWRWGAWAWPWAGSSTGRPKASVLPDPVLALPHTSRPARASVMVRVWMGKGCSMPRLRGFDQLAGYAEAGEPELGLFYGHVGLWLRRAASGHPVWVTEAVPMGKKTGPGPAVCPDQRTCVWPG